MHEQSHPCAGDCAGAVVLRDVGLDVRNAHPGHVQTQSHLRSAPPGDGLYATLAWTYVALRVVHSLVQALINRVGLRFLIFMIGSVVLLALTLRAAALIFTSA